MSPNPPFAADLVTFAEEILNGKLHFLSSGKCTLLNQCTKNIQQHLFGAIHLVRRYLMTNFSTPLPLYAPVNIFDDPSPFPQLRTYLSDRLIFN